MFRRRKSLHVGTDFGNDTDSCEITADTRSGLKNRKFLLIGSGERKNEFFELSLPGFEIFVYTKIRLRALSSHLFVLEKADCTYKYAVIWQDR